MTEQEYMDATDLARVRAAKDVLRAMNTSVASVFRPLLDLELMLEARVARSISDTSDPMGDASPESQEMIRSIRDAAMIDVQAEQKAGEKVDIHEILARSILPATTQNEGE